MKYTIKRWLVSFIYYVQVVLFQKLFRGHSLVAMLMFLIAVITTLPFSCQFSQLKHSFIKPINNIPKLVNEFEKVKIKHFIVAIGCIFLQEVWKLLLKCNAVKQSTSKFHPKHQRTNELKRFSTSFNYHIAALKFRLVYSSVIGWEKCTNRPSKLRSFRTGPPKFSRPVLTDQKRTFQKKNVMKRCKITCLY